MELYTNWSTALANVFQQMIEKLAQSMPNIFGALLLLTLGWVLAKILRTLTVRFARLIDKLISKFVKHSGIQRAKVPFISSQVFGEIVFWIVILVFVTAATNVLNLEIFTNWLNSIIGYLPTLLAGALIILAGLMISTLTRDVIYSALANRTHQQRLLLSRLVYVAILVTAIVIGADQIGINITFLVILLSVITATFLGGLSIAVSLGARRTVSNLISLHFFKQNYDVGDRIRIGDYEGKIINFTATSIVLDTAQGAVSFPATLCNDIPTIRLKDEVSDD